MVCKGGNGGRVTGAFGLAVLLCALAEPAHADTPVQTAFYPDPTIPNVPGPSYARFTLNVRATVGGSCGFADGGAPSATLDAGAIDTTDWARQAAFVPACTAPWRIAVSSQNGGLLTGTTPPSAAFANRAPYTVKLHVVHDTGTVEAQCAVADLTGTSAACDFDGTASASNGLQVPRSYSETGANASYIEASAPAYAGPEVLVAGAYADVLIVTVSPAT